MIDDAALGYEFDPVTDRARFRHRFPIDSTMYRLQKERFVQGSAGASPSDILVACLVTTTGLIVHDLVARYLALSSTLARFLIEFAMLPAVMVVTMFYPEYGVSVWLAQVGIGIGAVLARPRPGPGARDQAPLRLGGRFRFVTWIRSAFMLCTCCCILAVDFPLFPRRSIKTESFGVSIMDTGVGFVVFSGGLVSPQARASDAPASMGRALRASFPVLILGIIRLASVRAVHYQTHVSEYGLHWNFFLTLAVVALAAHLADPLVRRWSAGVLAVVVAVVAQILITAHLEFLLGAERHTLFSANREGLYSSLGYLAIYLAGVQVGRGVMHARSGDDWRRLVAILVGVSIAGLALVAGFGAGAVSRRFANLPFVAWIVALNTAVLALELTYDLMAGGDDVGGGGIVSGVDRNQLAIFLLGNLSTGALNLSLQTLYVDDDGLALIVVAAHVFVLSAVAAILDRARLSLKFW